MSSPLPRSVFEIMIDIGTVIDSMEHRTTVISSPASDLVTHDTTGRLNSVDARVARVWTHRRLSAFLNRQGTGGLGFRDGIHIRPKTNPL